MSDGASQFETCTITCRAGIEGDRAGQLNIPLGVATDSSGNVDVAAGDDRIEEFSAAGSSVKAYGWGVVDGMNQFETCTSTCQAGIPGGGAGQFNSLYGIGVATDPSGDVYVADLPPGRLERKLEAHIHGRVQRVSRVQPDRELTRLIALVLLRELHAPAMDLAVLCRRSCAARPAASRPLALAWASRSA